MVRNMTDRGARAALSALRAAFDATADGILVVDRQGNYVTSNRVFHEMWRIPRQLLRRGTERRVAKFALSQIKNADSLIAQVIEIHNSLHKRSRNVVQFVDGRHFECVSMPQLIAGKNVGRVWSFRDVTDRVRAELRNLHNAYHDSLTQLPNRALFQDRLTQEVGRARRSGSSATRVPSSLLGLGQFASCSRRPRAGERSLGPCCWMP